MASRLPFRKPNALALPRAASPVVSKITKEQKREAWLKAQEELREAVKRQEEAEQEVKRLKEVAEAACSLMWKDEEDDSSPPGSPSYMPSSPSYSY